MDTLHEQVHEFLDAALRRLRAALRENGTTLEAASENAGYNKQYASRVFSKKTNPTFEAVILLCIANKIMPERIFLDSDSFERMASYRTARQVLPNHKEELANKLAETFRKGRGQQ